ncbi:Prolyl endopeptidase precursor [Streptomyces sp. YIM 130001]|uniref:prolyl oligopeptidase family serine peptidase n=1 Tax=Streptomyces sp. YIM 130001 TaxID=2259644 RepID=UPI000EB8B743|nr:prolyl oligopeptidase family serine peptidase [Streptomyces sp. YIM 130001]RII09677.1 Prolyl endopeptidase precursor [Streptomyces sp. YIM 130001]
MKRPLDYPAARIEDEQETVCGVSFPDPYRWLEADSDETRAWQQAQNLLTDRNISHWPHFPRLLELVDHCTADGNGSPHWMVDPTPVFAGGRWFRLDRAPLEDGRTYPEAAVVRVSRSLEDDGRVVYDPRQDGTASVSWIAPSPDGTMVALGVSPDGGELCELRLYATDSAERLADHIPHPLLGRLSVPQWTPDSAGFFFAAVGDAYAFPVYYHRVGTDTPDTPEPVDAPDVPLVQVDPAGRYAVATSVWALPRYVCDLPARTWRPFVQDVDTTMVGVIDGDRYVAVTSQGAPRGRLVAVDFDSPTPGDPSTWQEVVPESERVLSHVRLVGGRLVVTGSVDTEARAWVFDRNGAELESVPLPGPGAFPNDALPHNALTPDGHPDEFVFVHSTPQSSPGLYRYRLGSRRLETLQPPRATLPGTSVSLRWADSRDGTRVPYHLVLPAGASGEEPLPTLITAYGGGQVAWPPQYPGPVGAFVASGGALVISHQRGGSDLGSGWGAAGQAGEKQTSYDDLYAIAEHLLATGVTTTDLLAVTGWSNGGIMAGAAFAQRPDLWAAVVSQCPILDLVGGHRDPYGKFAISQEFGSFESPEEVRRLAGMSPYQLVDDDGRYPWLYVHAGAIDSACPPGQIRKAVARIQAVTGPDAWALVRIWDGVGHGMASGRSEAILHTTFWLTFLMQRLGMSPPRTKGAANG